MDKIIIYVAGAPDLYPVEYYDPDTGTYQGMIPKLLREFSEKSIYDVRYYRADEGDIRKNMADNVQVDIISGCTEAEAFRHSAGQELVLLETVMDGEEVSFYLLLTDVAPKSLGADLQIFLSEVTWQDKAGLLLATGMEETPVYQKEMASVIGSFALTVLILLIILLALFLKYRRQRKLLKQRREVDELTGIGNMDYLLRNFKTHINNENRILYYMSYFHVNLEHIVRVGGRAQADEFLRYMAISLLDSASHTDIPAKVADDGFVLLRISPGNLDMEKWSLSVTERVRKIFEDMDPACASDVTVGIYQLKSGDYDLNEIIFNARQSALAAMKDGEACKICTDEALHALMEEKTLQADIEQAMRDEEFRLYIQFYVDVNTESVLGGEALSRWEHPERGFLYPGQFIPLMEREGLIGRLDYYLLDKVCALLQELYQAGIQDFFVSCNFSRETFSAGDFPDRFNEIIDSYWFPRKLLIIEITQSTIFRDPATAKRNIKAIKSRGIRLALDDFGEGITSFLDIQEQPLDVLKLDKSLVDNIGTNAGDAVLRAMIQIGHELGITVMAEGVESREQAQMLEEMNCRVVQGFCFYHPIPDWEAKRELQKLLSGREGGK